MYQLFIVTMLLALCVKNIGILWVAMEAATLATVLLVSLYRTPESAEFHPLRCRHRPGAVRDILLYLAAEKLLGGSVAAVIPVDVLVPGCPFSDRPAPGSLTVLLQGLITAVTPE